MDEKPYSIGLTISQAGKGIPYGGYRDGETNSDGTPKNRGFKNLKGRLHLLHEVPELVDNPGLFRVVEAINHSDNGLVSVGCAKWTRSDDKGHRCYGYIEFAINSAEVICDAQCYFPLFFHFNRMLSERRFSDVVNYHWELEGAHFWPSNADGFTCAVHVNTPYAPSFEEADAAWQEALEPLIEYLGGFPSQGGTPLFDSETDCELDEHRL